MLSDEYVLIIFVFNREHNATMQTMKTPITDATMSPEEFTMVLAALSWKQSDFCRKTGVTKQTPSRWANGQTPIPPWVRAYLGAMQDLAALHSKYLATTKADE